MGKDLYDNFSGAREIFHRADEALGMKLSSLCFEGPENELRRTINAQPAILAVSLACLNACEMLRAFPPDKKPNYVAGHSLGEYTALVAARVLSVENAIRLVRERGRLMQRASLLHKGGMAAILGLDETTCEEVCVQTGAQIANINTADQIVISGSREDLARAMDLAKARGARRVIPLDVSGAFHSQLMRPAAAGMAEAISRFPFKEPTTPIVANCTGKPIFTSAEVKHELIAQLCNCVRWRRSVEYMVDAGVSTFIEMGHGNILSELVKRISKDVEALNAEESLKTAYQRYHKTYL